MSWKASAFVKPLTHHKDGTPLSAREKLILFVLADSHNETRGNCAWISITLAAKDSLTSRSRFIELIKRLESKGTIRVERRVGMSSLYFFPDLPVRESDPPQKAVVLKSDPTRPIAAIPHPSDSCRTQASKEPLGTDITPDELASIELASKSLRPWNEILEGIAKKEREAHERYKAGVVR